jgi:alkylation response protein AidB-like acyl-CoA dehydrogenase
LISPPQIPNVAHILRAHFWFVEQQLQSAHAESRSRWLALVSQGKIFGNATSEQSGLQVGLFFETKLTRDADGIGYRLNGEKFYSTGSLYSDWLEVFASTPEGNLAARQFRLTVRVCHSGMGWLRAADDGHGYDHSQQRLRKARRGC